MTYEHKRAEVFAVGRTVSPPRSRILCSMLLLFEEEQEEEGENGIALIS
jgi:hypothetical protein